MEQKAKELEIPLDNKIVFKCEIIQNENLAVEFQEQTPFYIGKYDCIVHVGLGIYQPDRWTQKYNRQF